MDNHGMYHHIIGLYQQYINSVLFYSHVSPTANSFVWYTELGNVFHDVRNRNVHPGSPIACS